MPKPMPPQFFAADNSKKPSDSSKKNAQPFAESTPAAQAGDAAARLQLLEQQLKEWLKETFSGESDEFFVDKSRLDIIKGPAQGDSEYFGRRNIFLATMDGHKKPVAPALNLSHSTETAISASNESRAASSETSSASPSATRPESGAGTAEKSCLVERYAAVKIYTNTDVKDIVKNLINADEIQAIKKTLKLQKVVNVAAKILGVTIVYEASSTDSSQPQFRFVKIMEYAEKSLHDTLKGKIEDDIKIGYIEQLAEMLSAVHKNNYHILSLQECAVRVFDDGSIKLPLLTFSNDPKNNFTYVSRTSSGTPPYTPLEQLEEHYSAKCDVFAFGCILYRFITGTACWEKLPNLSLREIPYDHYRKVISSRHEKMRDALQLIQGRIKKGDIDDSPMYQLLSLCLKCLEEKPEERPKDGAELVSLLAEIRKNELIAKKIREELIAKKIRKNELKNDDSDSALLSSVKERLTNGSAEARRELLSRLKEI